MVSFEFKTDDLRTGLGQVFHMSAGGKGAGRGSKYGDRTPAIWTHSSRGFLVASAVNGRYSYAKYLKPVPSLGEWTSIEVRQEVVEAKSVYSVTIGGRKVLSVTNSKPSAFENVKVFASSGWYTSQPPGSAFIKNLLIQHKNYGKLV